MSVVATGSPRNKAVYGMSFRELVVVWSQGRPRRHDLFQRAGTGTRSLLSLDLLDLITTRSSHSSATTLLCDARIRIRGIDGGETSSDHR